MQVAIIIYIIIYIYIYIYLTQSHTTDWFTACSIIYMDYMTGTGLDIWTVSYDQCTHTHTHAHTL